MCGTSTASAIDATMPDVSDVPGPKIAATPSDNNSQTEKAEKTIRTHAAQIVDS
jgi:hypothetical protein